jgi:hypothetical protein
MATSSRTLLQVVPHLNITFGFIAFKLSKMIRKPLLFFVLLAFASCEKYKLPSEPKLSGRWRIDKVIYQRINGEDTVDQQYYLPGDQYIAPNDDSPLDSIKVGFTQFAMDYSRIYFKPHPTFAGKIKWEDEFIYTVSEVNFTFPGFISFDSDSTKNVWRVVYSDFENATLQLRGPWNPNSLGFYAIQGAENYDDIQIYITRLGP